MSDAILYISIVAALFSAIFGLSTIVRTRRKYYDDYIHRKRGPI